MPAVAGGSDGSDGRGGVAPLNRDGRRARSERTRAAIVEALLQLIEAGALEPTAQEIASRAGVALRSIGQHFESRESLFLAGTELVARRAFGARPVLDPALPLAERLTAFARTRARELTAGASLRRAVAMVEARSPAVASAARTMAGLRRAEVEHSFAPELAGRAPAERRRVLDGLDLVSTGKAWDVLTRDLGLAPTEAERQLAWQLAALLAAR